MLRVRLRVKLLIIALILATPMLALWLFANWFSWEMADFDCADGYWACRQDHLDRLPLRIGLPMLLWLLIPLALWRELKKS